MTGPVTQPVLTTPPPRAPVATATTDWDGGPSSPRAIITSLVLGGFILIPLLVRASVNFNPLPWWDMDPLTFVPAITGLTPATSLVCDGLVILAAALAVLRSAPTRLAVPAVAGAAACLWWNVHTVADIRLGTAWASGLLGAIALMSLCRQRPVRSALGAVLLGFIALLAVKGAVQWFIEHPDSVAAFKRDRALILAANGWEEGGAMAKGYERRLMQQEASGWFGLSNVLATFGAAGSVAFAGLLIGALRARAGGAALLSIALGLAESVGVLGMTGAKGALVAGGLGLGAMGVFLWLAARARQNTSPILARCAGALAVVVPLLVAAGVCVRGLIGERLGELSVWFRWFYWQAAATVGAGGGCGPSGFQDAYLLAKPPLSPEEVQSAHNAPMDWFAAFGWPSVVIALVFFGLLWRAGRGAIDTARAGSPEGSPNAAAAASAADWLSGAITRTVLLTIALATLLALYLDRSLMTENVAGVRLGGMVLWMVIALGAAGVIRRCGAVASGALAGAAVVLAAHGLFEVTGANQQACGVWWAMLGIAASTAVPRTRGRARLHGPVSIVAASLCTLLVFALAAAAVITMLVSTGMRAARLFTMEAHLQTAAEACRPASELRAWLTAAARTSSPAERDDAMARARAIVQASFGEPALAADSVARVQLAAIPPALTALDNAYRSSTAGPAAFTTWEIVRERSRLMLTTANLHAQAGHAAEAKSQAHLGVVEAQKAVINSPCASSWAWLATSALSANQLGAGGDDLLNVAFDALIQAQKFDPYNPSHAARKLKIAESAGWKGEIPALARELIRLDDLQRLDRSVRGLEPAERARVEALAKQN